MTTRYTSVMGLLKAAVMCSFAPPAHYNFKLTPPKQILLCVLLLSPLLVCSFSPHSWSAHFLLLLWALAFSPAMHEHCVIWATFLHKPWPSGALTTPAARSPEPITCSTWRRIHIKRARFALGSSADSGEPPSTGTFNYLHSSWNLGVRATLHLRYLDVVLVNWVYIIYFITGRGLHNSEKVIWPRSHRASLT